MADGVRDSRPVTVDSLSGYLGPAQHTWTEHCDGFHEPGPCAQQESGQELADRRRRRVNVVVRPGAAEGEGGR